MLAFVLDVDFALAFVVAFDFPDHRPPTTDYWVHLHILDRLFARHPDFTNFEHLELNKHKTLLDACSDRREQRDLERLIVLGRRIQKGAAGGRLERRTIARLLKIRGKDGLLHSLRPNRVQRAYSQVTGNKHIVLKARQMGLTTWIAGLFFVNTITHPGTMTVLVAHDQRAAEEIFRIVHRFWANLPMELRDSVLRTARCNVSQIIFPALDSQFRIETAADADAGRGLTIQNLHASEVARWTGDPAETLATLRAAVTPAGRIVLESTPSGAYGSFYEEWQKADETGYRRHFFPWWWEPSYTRPVPEPLSEIALADNDSAFTDEERELIERHSLSPEQIEFRREIRRNYRHLAPQEFAEDAETCFLASGDCYFDVEAIDKRLSELPEQVYKPNSLLTLLEPAANRQYIIGVDTAGGGSTGDYCCAQVVDKKLGVQCAELHGRWTPPEFADELYRLGERYHWGKLVIERNNHGHAVIYLLEKRNYPNLAQDERGGTGLLTTTASRPRMLAELASLLVESPWRFGSRALLNEMRTFVRNEQGKAEAAGGSHDDRVLAMALCQCTCLAVTRRSWTS